MPGCRVEAITPGGPNLLHIAAHGIRPGGRYQDCGRALLMSLIVKRVRLQGFLNADHVDTAFATFEAQAREWLDSG